MMDTKTRRSAYQPYNEEWHDRRSQNTDVNNDNGGADYSNDTYAYGDLFDDGDSAGGEDGFQVLQFRCLIRTCIEHTTQDIQTLEILVCLQGFYGFPMAFPSIVKTNPDPTLN